MTESQAIALAKSLNQPNASQWAMAYAETDADPSRPDHSLAAPDHTSTDHTSTDQASTGTASADKASADKAAADLTFKAAGAERQLKQMAAKESAITRSDHPMVLRSAVAATTRPAAPSFEVEQLGFREKAKAPTDLEQRVNQVLEATRSTHDLRAPGTSDEPLRAGESLRVTYRDLVAPGGQKEEMVRLNDRGTIQLLPTGDVACAGLSPRQAEKAIADAIAHGRGGGNPGTVTVECWPVTAD